MNNAYKTAYKKIVLQFSEVLNSLLFVLFLSYHRHIHWHSYKTSVCIEWINFVFVEILSLFLVAIEIGRVLKMSELIAVTEYGKVRGIKKTSALDDAYNAFLGIRYATPPVGELRFKVRLLNFEPKVFHERTP